jgi:hypothetical protein
MVPHLVPKKKTCIHQTFMLLLQAVDKDARKCKNYNKEYIYPIKVKEENTKIKITESILETSF